MYSIAGDEDDPVTVERTTEVLGPREVEGVKTDIELGQEEVAKNREGLLLLLATVQPVPPCVVVIDEEEEEGEEEGGDDGDESGWAATRGHS